MGCELSFSTYIITNAKSGTLYVGHTDNLNERMEQHIAGHYGGFSKRYGLKHLVWQQSFESRNEAFVRERQIKEWKRKWKINLVESENPHWIDLHTVPVWPLPDRVLFDDLYNECLKHRLDPDLRRDERR